MKTKPKGNGMVVRLQPSPIHGVGVFTVRPVKKGEVITLFDNDAVEINDPLKAEARHCIRKGVGAARTYSGPKNFHRMSIGWYLNHTSNFDEANVVRTWNERTNRYVWSALRALKYNEELLVSTRQL